MPLASPKAALRVPITASAEEYRRGSFQCVDATHYGLNFTYLSCDRVPEVAKDKLEFRALVPVCLFPVKPSLPGRKEYAARFDANRRGLYHWAERCLIRRKGEMRCCTAREESALR